METKELPICGGCDQPYDSRVQEIQCPHKPLPDASEPTPEEQIVKHLEILVAREFAQYEGLTHKEQSMTETRGRVKGNIIGAKEDILHKVKVNGITLGELIKLRSGCRICDRPCMTRVALPDEGYDDESGPECKHFVAPESVDNVGPEG